MSADVDEQKVWEGAAALEGSLALLSELEPFPGNPRRGDVAAIMASLRRFGQVKPIVVDGSRIVAGHHIVLAAGELGWTHVSAVQNEFASEEEQRAFLLSDNRTSELGTYDNDLLLKQLMALNEVDALEGTGYTSRDVDDYLADVRRRADTPSMLSSSTKREHRDPGVKELVLLYSEEQLAQVEEWLNVVAREKGTGGVSETVYEALRVAALAA